MFALLDDAKRPAVPPQGLHWIWAIGLALNAISVVMRPPHQHHGFWFWCTLAGLGLMVAGIFLTRGKPKNSQPH